MIDVPDIKYVRGLRLICQYPNSPVDPNEIIEWYVDDVTPEQVEWIWVVRSGINKGKTDTGFTPWELLKNPKAKLGEDYHILEIIYPDTEFDEDLFTI